MTTLRLPARKKTLGTVKDLLAAPPPRGFSRTLDRAQLALEELPDNVFGYACPPGGEGLAPICRPEDRDGEALFCVQVRDWEAPLHPLSEAPAPDLGSPAGIPPPGGPGASLIKSVTARPEHERRDDANVITLHFGGSDA